MIRYLLALIVLMATPAFAQVKSIEMAFDNGAGRQVPITVIAKPGKAKGVIVFWHGGFSSPAKYREITTRWAKAGYAVFAPLHADSSDWKGVKPELMEQTNWRMADMKLTYASIPALAEKAKVHIGKVPYHSAGHSFGALIAMMDPDPRVTSILSFSPPGPFPGITLPVVSKPMLTITGTKDIVPGIAPKWEDHLVAHKSATGPAWAYVGDGADHYYGGIFCRPEVPGPKVWGAFEDAMALSLRFLKAPTSVAGYKLKAGNLQAR